MRSILLTLALIASTSALAHAQELEPELLEQQLALALARTTMNEASFNATPADLYLTWQVVEGHGATTAERLAWLRAHSSCVNSDRPQTERELRGNCRWTRHLDSSGNAPKYGWPSAFRWEGWRARVWVRMQELALRLVRGARYPRPCVETPDTWGGAMDHARALERGMRPVACTGVRNAGYLYATR